MSIHEPESNLQSESETSGSVHFSDSEGELTLCAGDYLLVWGSGEPQGGYFDAELLDGRRGLVPASYVQRLIG